MKLSSSAIFILFFPFVLNSMVLIQHDSINKLRKNKVKNILIKQMGIPEELIESKVITSCEEDNLYDIVICLQKKNGGELKFPTVKNFLIKNKYEIFK